MKIKNRHITDKSKHSHEQKHGKTQREEQDVHQNDKKANGSLPKGDSTAALAKVAPPARNG
jgi:hypothetical protein